MPLPIILYGATDCDDTERTRTHLRRLGIPFWEVNIDHNPEAERFVIFINRGHRSTPTLVVGEGKFRIVVTEPTDRELDQVLMRADFSVPDTTCQQEALTWLRPTSLAIPMGPLRFPGHRSTRKTSKT